MREYENLSIAVALTGYVGMSIATLLSQNNNVIAVEIMPEALMVIKSAIPVGYTESIRIKYNSRNIIFSPEFLRESKALYDNLYPSRSIVSTDVNDVELTEKARIFAKLPNDAAKKRHRNTYNGFYRR